MKLQFQVIFLFLLLASCNFEPKTDTSANKQNKNDKVLLRVNFAKDFKQEVTYTIHNFILESGSSDETAVIKYGLDSVIGVDNRVYTFSGDIVRVKFDSDFLGRKVTYDSSIRQHGNSKSLFEEKVSRVLDKSFTFSIDGKSKILKEIEFGGKVSSVDYQPVQLMNYFISFPEEEIQKGSSWQNSYIDSKTGQKVTSSYKVASIEGGLVFLDVTMLVAAKGSYKESLYRGTYTINANLGMPFDGRMSGGIVGSGGETTFYFQTKTL